MGLDEILPIQSNRQQIERKKLVLVNIEIKDAEKGEEW
jgi:hypothetical protein